MATGSDAQSYGTLSPANKNTQATVKVTSKVSSNGGNKALGPNSKPSRLVLHLKGMINHLKNIDLGQ